MIPRFGRGPMPKGTVARTLVVQENINRNDGHRNLPSKVTLGQDVSLKPPPKYTGTEMIGVSVIHKSGLQPIFSKDSAEDVAKMRR